MLNVLWYVLGWMVIGLVTEVAVGAIHTMQAIKRYGVDTVVNVWDDYFESDENAYDMPVSKMSTKIVVLAFMWGVLIWPVRIVQFAMNQQSIYQDYEDEKNYPDDED